MPQNTYFLQQNAPKERKIATKCTQNLTNTIIYVYLEGNVQQDTMKGLLKRYVWLIDIIYHNNGLTYNEINQKWRHSVLNETGEDLPLRTFHNHRKCIADELRVNIKCRTRGDYKYYIENDEDLQDDSPINWLAESLSARNLIEESKLLKGRIILESIPRGREFLSPLIEAMKDSHAIAIKYQRYNNEEVGPFLLKPYCIRLWKRRWYMVAQRLGQDDVQHHQPIKIYALDRIKEMTVTQTPFKLPKNFNSENYFNHSTGIIVYNDQPQEVNIRISNDQAPYWIYLPLHHSQQVIDQTETHTTFSFHIIITFDFIQEIMCWGRYIEVLQPLSLRKELYNMGKIIQENNILEVNKT